MPNSSYYILRILLMIWKCSPFWTVLNALLVIVRGLIPLAQLWAVKIIIDITSRQITQQQFSYREALCGLLIMGGIYVATSVLASIHSIIKERHSYKLSDAVSSIIHQKTTKVGYVFFDDAHYHNVFFRAVAESGSKPQGVFYNVINLAQELLTIASLALLLWSLHWLLPFIVILLGLPIVVIRIWFSRQYFALQREQTIDERKTQYYNRVLTSREFAKEVRIFGLATHFRQLFLSTLSILRKKRLNLLYKRSLRESVVQFIASIAFVAVFGFVMWQAVVTNLSVGMLAMYLMALQRSYGTSQDILERIAALYDSNLFLKNFFDFVDMPLTEEEQSADNAEQGTIIFDNVSFSYPNAKNVTLKGVSFRINKGETIAIVGRNGCGKSTLVKLICKLYNPQNGSVKVGGKISAIFQDFMLYNASATDNIRFGELSKIDVDKNAVRQAAKNAGIDVLFNSLPNGYETQLGNLTPESNMLSQGQWQRVALARSFYADADIIVMDEPTSSLDVFTEAALTENFKAITHGRTAVIVSHRLSSIKMANKIMVVDDGRIVDYGSYSELMQKDGLFKDMVNSLDEQT